MSNDRTQSPVERPASETAVSGAASVQGEGDYQAAQRYREDVSEFLAHADVEELAERAAPESALEARELALAADRGRQRSKGDDPADVEAMYPGKAKA